MILKDIVWKLPILKPARHDERLQFIEENVFELFLLEQKEEVVEQEVAVLDSYTELDTDSDDHSVPFFGLGSF